MILAVTTSQVIIGYLAVGIVAALAFIGRGGDR